MKEKFLLKDSVLSEVTRRLSNPNGRAGKQCLRLLSGVDDHLFVWSGRDQLVLAVNTSPSEDEKEPVQSLALTDCPLFDVEGLRASRTGKWLAIFGKEGISAVEVPRRSGVRGRLGGGEPDLVCRTVSISLPVGHRSCVQSVDWHPGSVGETHLVVLTTDNVVRVHNVGEKGCPVVQTLHLAQPAADRADGSGLGPGTASVAESLGETAVDFTFGPCVESGEGLAWPVFVLWANGDVFCGSSNLGWSGDVELDGPLEIQPPVEDNYKEEACSVAVVGERSGPSVLVIATVGGSVYHAVVLGDDSGRVSLHMYEKVELELSLTPDDMNVFSCPVRVESDPVSPSRYLASHEAGLHQVSLPLVSSLANLELDPAESPAIVQHLVCTRPTPSSPLAPVLGTAIVFPPPSLVFLSSNHSLQKVQLAATVSAPPPLISADPSSTSPLRLQSKEPLDRHIQQILSRSTSQPIIQSGETGDMTRAHCLDLLLRSTATLRTEYINKMEVARLELGKRAGMLVEKRLGQEAALNKLEKDRIELRKQAETLSERYEDVRDSGERLTRRVEAVLSAVQRRLPVASDAELQMSRNVKQLERQLLATAGAVQQLREKEIYQRRQVSAAAVQRRPATAPEMDENQLNNVKKLLQSDSKQIADLVKNINFAKKDLGI